MLADFRDHIAVTLMGWAARLATKQYQHELATYIQLGMAADPSGSAPAYCEANIMQERQHGGHAAWVSIN